MNQEQNNLNPNNFNTQGNNGIPNNQPLNNQSFNQQPINPQPQPTPSFQQPINQMNVQQPTPQPVNNTFESGNANNQSFNSKPPKKVNLGLIIGIVATVAVVGIVVILLVLSGNKNSNKPLNNNGENNNNISDSIAWDDYRIVIDNSEIKLPMKYSDFLALGFYEMDTYHDSLNQDQIQPKDSFRTYNSNVGNIFGLYTNGTTSNISLVIYNDSDEIKSIQDCYIIEMSFIVEARNIDFLKTGNIKIINKTKNAEAIFGQSKISEISDLFGPHYQYDYTNTLTYYPDLNSDNIINMDDLSSEYALHLYFDEETQILDVYDFFYYEHGNLK